MFNIIRTADKGYITNGVENCYLPQPDWLVRPQYHDPQPIMTTTGPSTTDWNRLVHNLKNYSVEQIEETITVYVKMAGFRKEDTTIHVDSGNLYIKAESDLAFIGELYQETIPLPKHADLEQISAEFKNGLLVVKIETKNPKKEVLIS